MLAYLIDRRRTVHADGLRLSCRQPTVATVVECARLFASEIEAARIEMDKIEVDVASVLQGALEAFADRGDHRVSHVLATCVEGLERDERRPSVLRAAVAGVLAVTDVDRLMEEVSQNTDGDGFGSSAVDSASAGLVAIARQFGLAPHEVLDWPYLELCVVADVLEAEAKEAEARAKAAAKGQKYQRAQPIQEVSIPGLGGS